MASQRQQGGDKVSEPLELGTVVNPYGKIVAVAWITGERYYFLIAKNKSVAMMPACSLEPSASAQGEQPEKKA